jgi:predicted  nucleic acid-binding Zn-ribbon protein
MKTEELQEIDRKIKHRDRDMTVLTKKNVALKQDVAQCEKTIADLKAQIEALQGKIKSVETQRTKEEMKHTEEVSALRLEVRNMEVRHMLYSCNRGGDDELIVLYSAS